MAFEAELSSADAQHDMTALPFLLRAAWGPGREDNTLAEPFAAFCCGLLHEMMGAPMDECVHPCSPIYSLRPAP